MKIILMSAFMSVILSSNAFAALSGYYDSVLKIKAALEDSAVANSLHQGSITSVEVNGSYVEVKTAHCYRGVVLKAIPPQGIGSTQYEVESLTANGCP